MKIFGSVYARMRKTDFFSDQTAQIVCVAFLFENPSKTITSGKKYPRRIRVNWGLPRPVSMHVCVTRALTFLTSSKAGLCFFIVSAGILFQACPPQGVRPKTDRTEHGTEPIEPKPSAPTNQPGSTTRCDTYIDRTEPTKCRRSRVSTEPIEPNISTFRISIEPIADKLGDVTMPT